MISCCCFRDNANSSASKGTHTPQTRGPTVALVPLDCLPSVATPIPRPPMRIAFDAIWGRHKACARRPRRGLLTTRGALRRGAAPSLEACRRYSLQIKSKYCLRDTKVAAWGGSGPPSPSLLNAGAPRQSFRAACCCTEFELLKSLPHVYRIAKGIRGWGLSYRGRRLPFSFHSLKQVPTPTAARAPTRAAPVALYI